MSAVRGNASDFRSRLRWRSLPLAAGLLFAPLLAAEEYRIDPVHTRIVFAVDHLGFSAALGTLSGATGTLHFDPDDWSSARIIVELPLERVDFGDEAWNRRMARRDFFDLDEHPVARFESTGVTVTGENRATVEGMLTLRGEQVPVALDVKLNRKGIHPYTFESTVGFSATATLDRTDFGMTRMQRVVGTGVEVRIELEANVPKR